ncbi:MAG: Unknown protein [uncultured Sulfurovum sp.]|uniref:DOMON-like domain-containing protein n=1 Tax=uncultured Sulfurovum sp. TaxID=269237 RepID=A0A6S6S656_9BACT|nr:MAG: Unknown protein [uncultured Sulfurovum sp.]
MKNRLILNTAIQNLSINSTLHLTNNKVQIRFVVKGELNAYIFPPKSKLQRANELWKATCFELFLADSQKEEYYEINFSSSLVWNFYYLKNYRAEVQELKLLNEPKIEVQQNEDEVQIDFELEIENLEKFDIYNVASIFLTKDNERTFWSVKHEKDVPDFHNRATFLQIK